MSSDARLFSAIFTALLSVLLLVLCSPPGHARLTTVHQRHSRRAIPKPPSAAREDDLQRRLVNLPSVPLDPLGTLASVLETAPPGDNFFIQGPAPGSLSKEALQDVCRRIRETIGHDAGDDGPVGNLVDNLVGDGKSDGGVVGELLGGGTGGASSDGGKPLLGGLLGRRGLLDGGGSPLDLLDLDKQYGKAHYYSSQNTYFSPACVLRPRTEEAVAAAFSIVRDAGAAFAIKGGGHSGVTGWSSTNGVLLDMSKLNNLQMGRNGQARVQAGMTGHQVYDRLAEQDLTYAGPRYPNVGFGFFLGAGLSYMFPQIGYGNDQVSSFRWINPTTAQLEDVTRQSDPDLFWALKGGGNSLGIVTSIEVNTFPNEMVWGGPILYPFGEDMARQLSKAVIDFTRNNPDPRASILHNSNFVQVAGWVNFVLLVWRGGPDPPPDNVFAPFLSLPQLGNKLGPKRYSGRDGLTGLLDDLTYGLTSLLTSNDVQSTFDFGELFVANHDNTFLTGTWRADRITADEVMSAIHSFLDRAGEKVYEMTLNVDSLPATGVFASQDHPFALPLGGKAACGYISILLLVSNMGSISTEDKAALLREFRTALPPSEPGLPLYVNYAAAGQKALQTYAEFDRLLAVKRRVDPANIFGTLTAGPSYE